MPKKILLFSLLFLLILSSLFTIENFNSKDIRINQVKAAGEGWYNAGGTWNYRKKITINNNLVADVDNPSTTYANFPILISTTGLSNIKENGSDIRFTMANGITEIPREIESYDSGNLEAWVKLTLTKDAGDSTNDEIYMYYGNSNATEPAANSDYGRNNVWSDTGAVGIWHMAEGAGDYIYDSSGNGNTGTITGADWVANGLDFITANDYVDCGVSPAGGLSELTVLTRIKPINSTTHMVIEDGSAYNTNAFYINLNNGKPEVEIFVTNYNTRTSTDTISLTEYTDIALRWKSGEAIQLYLNGVEDTNTAVGHIQTGVLKTGDENLTFGGRPPTPVTNDYNGLMAYTKIYNRALFAEEIETQYNN
ncbi:MAG: DUF2341 domain-containing protein, partial [Candidatus Aenigmarchaeota archaeon]|nr:DUF2341 domain-containing protein [Candidatus Aenigmarchaeota archaeon]